MVVGRIVREKKDLTLKTLIFLLIGTEDQVVFPLFSPYMSFRYSVLWDLYFLLLQSNERSRDIYTYYTQTSAIYFSNVVIIIVVVEYYRAS